jgi:hypothetical protein
MTNTSALLKTLRSMTEAEYVGVVTEAARKQYPELSAPRAFAKVFEDPGPEGKAIRAAWAITKGQSIVGADSAELDYRAKPRSRGVRGGPLTEDETDEADSEIMDDALEELDALAEKERRRNPGMTKAAAFAKVYCDPQHAHLAKRERSQSLRKLYR